MTYTPDQIAQHIAQRVASVGEDSADVRILRQLVADAERMREALEWWESQRADAIERSSMTVREDPEVLALCNRYGFGAVMDSTSRQWVKKDNSGAFFIGGCVGDTSARAALSTQEKAHD